MGIERPKEEMGEGRPGTVGTSRKSFECRVMFSYSPKKNWTIPGKLQVRCRRFLREVLSYPPPHAPTAHPHLLTSRRLWPC